MRRLGALAVNDRRRRARFAPFLIAHRDIELVMNALQRSIPIPQHEIVMDRTLGWQVLGQGAPLAARPQHVENAVEHLTHVHIPPPPATASRRNFRLDQRPLAVGEVACIAKTVTLCRRAVLRCPHGCSHGANQLWRSESQPTLQTQQVLGSALSITIVGARHPVIFGALRLARCIDAP